MENFKMYQNGKFVGSAESADEIKDFMCQFNYSFLAVANGDRFFAAEYKRYAGKFSLQQTN